MIILVNLIRILRAHQC